MMFRQLLLSIATLALLSSSCHSAEYPSNRIAGYLTKSHVTGSSIDKDLVEIRQLLAEGDFAKAKDIFRHGNHADPYAKLALEEPLREAIVGSNNDDGIPCKVVGLNEDAQPVQGRISTSAKQGATTLYIRYDETANLESDFGLCQVGGRLIPKTQGCFAARGGLILEDYGAINYRYVVEQDNAFWSTLYGFSEQEAEQMFHCHDDCPYPEYEKFYHYYGQLDYGALWMEAALEGRTTDFENGKFAHGQEDFSLLEDNGRAAAIETAAVTMNVRTQVNRIMTEWAIDRCHKECGHGGICQHVTEPWDQAVAQYVGSLVQPNEELAGGYEPGQLYYGLADDLCQDFATCGLNGDDIEGQSSVNQGILQLFQSGRFLLEKGSCDTAQLTYGQIVHLMTVPLIQGVLRSAHRLQYTNPQDSFERGRGVAFAASLLPDLYSCSHMDASIVYEEMKLTNKGTPNFSDIKEALERNYQCLSVTCEDVGGLYDADLDQYIDGAQPCGKRRTRQRGFRRRSDNKHNETLWYGAGQFFLVCNIVIVALVVTHRRWVPAISSRADVILTKAGVARFFQTTRSSQSLHQSFSQGPHSLPVENNGGLCERNSGNAPSGDYHKISEEEDAIL